MKYLLFSDRKKLAKEIKEDLQTNVSETDILNILTIFQKKHLKLIEKCKFNNDDICVNADSEHLADYCPIIEYKELLGELEMINEELNEMSIARTIQQYLKNNDIKVSNSLLPLHIEDMLLKDGYRKIKEGCVIIQKGVKIDLFEAKSSGFMTSAIGDIPLNIDGMRMLVDEVSRLLRVQKEKDNGRSD